MARNRKNDTENDVNTDAVETPVDDESAEVEVPVVTFDNPKAALADYMATSEALDSALAGIGDVNMDELHARVVEAKEALDAARAAEKEAREKVDGELSPLYDRIRAAVDAMNGSDPLGKLAGHSKRGPRRPADPERKAAVLALIDSETAPEGLTRGDLIKAAGQPESYVQSIITTELAAGRVTRSGESGKYRYHYTRPVVDETAETTEGEVTEA